MIIRAADDAFRTIENGFTYRSSSDPSHHNGGGKNRKGGPRFTKRLPERGEPRSKRRPGKRSVGDNPRGQPFRRRINREIAGCSDHMDHFRNKLVAGSARSEMELDGSALRLAKRPLNVVR